MNFLSFLKTKTFFIHTGLALLSAFLLIWLGFTWAASYTQHNQTVAVPDFSNLPIGDLDHFVKDKKVHYQIIDSIYNPQEKPGMVLKQDPEKGSEVKENRTVYLYITSVLPPQISMPKLVDKSMRQALAMAESYGLKTKLSYVSDDCKNCVVKQLYKGKAIEPGTPLKKGSVIELQIGKGNEAAPSATSAENAEKTTATGDEELIQ
ncbi:MAG: PASTA domain-containing protein [Bacteroidetes bacterium]|nr:PASTA domain-containing protein [Bacteroidota bacterium]